MKLRRLARTCLVMAMAVLVLASALGGYTWLSVDRELEQSRRVEALHDRAMSLGVAIDYVTLLRQDSGVLAGIAGEARDLASDIEILDHPKGRFGATHFREIAYLADTLLERSTRVGTRAADSGQAADTVNQLLIHRSGGREALELISDTSRDRMAATLAGSLFVTLIALLVMIALAVAAFLLIHRRLGRPLEAIQRGIQNMAPGGDSRPIELHSGDELQELADAFNQVAAQRNRYEETLRQSEQRFRQLAENIREVFWTFDTVQRRLLYLSPAFEEIWGRPAAPFHRWPALALRTIHPEDRTRVRHCLYKGNADSEGMDFRIVRPDGGERWINAALFPVPDNGGSRVIGVARDITEQVSMRRQLNESQRLEALGQLTGGVAHDFNNLLTVIIGNADLLEEGLGGDQRLQGMATMVGSAAQRGADLTQRLLAFARRQPLAPRRVDINQLLDGLDELLRRTLGEQVELEVVHGAGLWPACIDPAQLESAVLNLAINARDAMPGGGRLTLESANVHMNADYAQRYADIVPGQYVMVAVSDTGTGIAPDAVERVFEPFYTTKGKGQGSGLGLSMVYGFIKQSEGHVKIYSEPGEGTTVRMYLPRFTGPAQAGDEPVDETPVVGGVETILLAEDDELVRGYAESQLKGLGYLVLSAVDGDQAMAILHERDDIDLLFTDVIMPGRLGGRDLADAARRLYPDLRVLYTSGYTENAIIHHGRLDPGVHLLAKPYRRAELARRIRQALDAPAVSAS